ncbi:MULTISPECIES: DUF1493 family protein [Pseudomonas]|jgi:hypothetical protein|uniref:DUF1493 family protein n=1 Tax=Pseudomonas TaxID=286 RepID=UPI001F5DEA11|nr:MULTISPECIES: DUF1493 family protein [Pseudomonas]
MTDYTQWINLLFLLVLAAIIERTIKLSVLRKWLGLCLLITGPALLFHATHWIKETHLESLPIVALVTGIGLLSTQNLYCKAQNTHPLFIAATMNLAPDFPEDPVMQQLLQLLHEEIGLPKHRTIRLQTSLNFDLGCDGNEAKQLMETLEQEFALDLGDFDTYRYFNPPVFDVFLKRRAKGRGEKVPLTINMLYLAIKTHSWNTQTLENLS